MAYIPQFIPTNTQVLQGTLDQYQKGYDTETNRQNQVNDVYSAIPTTRTYDTVEKNKAMGVFVNNLSELDKKYNYDRSNQQYAKELTSQITNLRANPLWAHIQQKDEVDKMRQQLIAQRGVNYHENVNPNTATLNNTSPLTDWKPTDLKDVKLAAASWAKEFATSKTGEIRDNSTPGWIRVVEQYGPKDMGEAINFLTGQKKLNGLNGPEQLNNIISASGFDPNDPVIKNAAHEAFLTEAVGKPVEKWEPDKAYLAEQARLAKQGETQGLIQTSTGKTPVVTPYAVTNTKEIPTLLKNINVAKTAIANEPDQVKKDALINNYQELNRKKGEVDNIINMSRIKHADVVKTGEDFLKQSIPQLSDEDVTKLNNKLIDLHNNTSNFGRNPIGQGIRSFATILGKISKSTPEILKTILQPDVGSFLSNLAPTGLDLRESVVDAANTISSAKNTRDTMYKLGSVVYNNELEKGTGKLGAIQKAETFINDYRDYYKGSGLFVNRGYDKVNNDINTKLSTGKQSIFNEFGLPSHMETAKDKGQIMSLITDNMSAFTPLNPEHIQGGKDGMVWKKGRAEELASAFSNPETSFHALFDNQDQALINLSDPGSTSGTNKRSPITESFKIDPAKASFDLLAELSNRTHDPRFMSQIYTNFNLVPNQEYSVDEKDGYLPLQLGRYYQTKDNNGKSKPDIEAFKGFRIKYIEDQSGDTRYEVTAPGENTVEIPNKVMLLTKLGEFRDQYNLYNKSIKK